MLSLQRTLWSARLLCPGKHLTCRAEVASSWFHTKLNTHDFKNQSSSGSSVSRPVAKSKKVSGSFIKKKILSQNFDEQIKAMSSGDLPDENWGDTFGTLDDNPDKDLLLENVTFADDEKDKDDTEDKPFQRLSDVDRRNKPIWYGIQLEKLGKEGKVKEAIDMFEKKMLVEDRVRPNEYVFTVLISVLAQVGYTKKAFQMFNKMKKFGLRPVDHTYTALFNACSNSPWKDDGLKRANKLRELMKQKEYEPNRITYCSMIKCYAVLGDVETAFSIADEMDRRQIRSSVNLLNNLLMAAISHKQAGLLFATWIWKRLRKRSVHPDISSYNLLLRATKECSIGDPQQVLQLINKNTRQIPAKASGPQRVSSIPSLTAPHDEPEALQINDTNGQTADQTNTLVPKKKWFEMDLPETLNDGIPDLLDGNADFSNVVGLNDLSGADQRLLLLGGLDGVMRHMEKDKVKPDIRTFTLLLDLVPPTEQAEKQLIEVLDKSGTSPDTPFLNWLIRRRNIRKDFNLAKNSLSLFHKYELSPDMATYGCLAMGCRSRSEGNQLLDELQRQGTIPSVHLCGILVQKSGSNFSYKLDIIKRMAELSIKPNEKLIQNIEASILVAKKNIVALERGEQVSSYHQTEHFKEGFNNFMIYYKKWLLNTEFEAESHPWAGFQEEVEAVSSS